MLTVEQTEKVMRDDPVLFGHLISLALQQPQIVLLVARQVKHEHACGCLEGSLTSLADLTGAINTRIREAAENSVRLVAAIDLLNQTPVMH